MIYATWEKIWTGVKSMTDGLLSILSIESPLPPYENCIPATAIIAEKGITPGWISGKNESDRTVKPTASTDNGLQIIKTKNASEKLIAAHPILGWYVGNYYLHDELTNGFPNTLAGKKVPVYVYFYTADESVAKCIVYIKESLPKQTGVFEKVSVSLAGSSKHEIYSPGRGKYYGVGKQVSFYLPTAIVKPHESLASRPEDYAVLFYTWDNYTDYYYYTTWDANYTGLTAPAALTEDELRTINDFILSSSREEVLN